MNEFKNVEVDGRTFRYVCRGSGSPTVVLEQGFGMPTESRFRPGYIQGLAEGVSRDPESYTCVTPELSAKLEQVWLGLQVDLLSLSRNIHRVATVAGHLIQLDEPRLVIDAVLDVLRHTRTEFSAAALRVKKGAAHDNREVG